MPRMPKVVKGVKDSRILGFKWKDSEIAQSVLLVEFVELVLLVRLVSLVV